MSQVMLNRLIPLWNSLANQARVAGCTNSEDIASFGTRARAEGLPYVSDGLAGLAKLLLDALGRGYVIRGEFAVTRHVTKEGSTLPLFLYSAWSKVFNDDGTGIGASFETDDEGVLRLTAWEPPIEAAVAVGWLRQLTVVFAKLHLPYSKSRVEAVFERFRANEQDLAQIKGFLWETQYANQKLLPFRGDQTQSLTDVLLRARRLIYKILCNVNPAEIMPKHGKGASACGTRPWERYSGLQFDPELNSIWPYLEFAASGKDHVSQILSADFITEGYPKCAKGVFVPKDYRGPRLISCEPATSMYFQQGLMSLMVEHLESTTPTRGFVNFTKQGINQVLAREGSIDRKTATLDLKDASDRLSWDLVILLFPPHWLKALSAVRSKVTKIAVPGKGTITVPLRKHAPMGSAVCFPVMALSIWALIKSAQFTKNRSKAWIYGDDIIVASNEASAVIDLLESVGLAVNTNKSFTGPTPFRESCGKEYWNGSDVTPIYCRYNPVDDDSEAASLCAFANNMAERRGLSACSEITLYVHRLTGCPIFGVPDELTLHSRMKSDLHMFPDLGQQFSPSSDVSYGINNPRPLVLYGADYLCQRASVRRRFHGSHDPSKPSYQKWEYRVKRPYPVFTSVEPSNWGYVLRSSLIGGDLGFSSQIALAKRVVYKYGWVSIDW